MLFAIFAAGSLTFREFAMREPLPLVTIQEAVLEFLRRREDVALFGAQAVNAYTDEPRMTQDVDLLSTRAKNLAEELRDHLAHRFNIAVRLRKAGEGRGYRLYQVAKPKNRHLVDVETVDQLPATQEIEGVQVVEPAELVARKVIALHHRRGQPKSGTDWRDLACLLLAFPELKSDRGPVHERLEAANVAPSVLSEWGELVAQEIVADEDAELST